MKPNLESQRYIVRSLHVLQGLLLVLVELEKDLLQESKMLKGMTRLLACSG